MLRARDIAVLDALLPSGAAARLPGLIEADIESFLEGFQASAPASLRLGFRLALWTAAWISPLLIRRLPPLSRLDPEARERALEAMGRSRRPLLRQLMLLLKMTAGLGYGAHPAVRSAIGCPRPVPLTPLPVGDGALGLRPRPRRHDDPRRDV